MPLAIPGDTLFPPSPGPTLSGQDLFATPEEAFLPTPPAMTHPAGRAGFSLQGTWNALIDPSVFSLNDRMRFAERNYRAGPGELVEVDLEGGLTLRVPGDWNTQDDRLFFYQGKVWYKRDFHLEPEPGRRYFLHFGAVNYLAQVHVNGTHVASHRGGYTPFQVEVTEQLRDGDNLLVVKVDNRLSDTEIPTTRTDWLNYGGITRDVRLLEVPATFIHNFKLQVQADDPNRIQGWVEVDGAASGPVGLEIPELDIREQIELIDGRGTFSLAAAPERWSPQSPRLYEVIWTVGQDTLRDAVGFRTLAVADRQILLNGEPLFLKGISIHEEAIGSRGRTSSPAEAIELLEQARALGCNFVRLAHYTHNEYMVRAADRLGLLVWSEIPVYWNVAFDNPEVLAMAKTRMREMIGRDQNRASILFWSLGNETPVSEARNTFFRELNDYVKSLDDSRLTTAALVFGGEEIQRVAQDYYFPTMQGQTFDTWDIHIEDPLAAIVDVAAINQYFGWYYSGFLAQAAGIPAPSARQTMLDNMHRIRFHIPGNKPFVFSEFGAGAKRGLQGSPDEMVIFSEAYQALVYERQIALIREQEGLVGLSPWILKDFRSPMRLNQGIQDYWNRKGLITDNGEPKQAFFVLRDFYRSLDR